MMLDVKFKLILAGLIGIIGAVVLGNWMPHTNLSSVLMLITIGGILVYTFMLSRYAFYFAVFSVMLDLSFRPFGFLMDASVQVGALFGPLYLLTIWRKNLPTSETLIKTSREYRFITYIVGAYILIHFGYTWLNPVLTFSFSNVGKTYYTLYFPFVLMALMIVKPPIVRIGPDTLRLVGWAILIGQICNILILIYGIFVLGYSTNDFEATEAVRSIIYIPILNISENIFALRQLSPLAALFATSILTSRSKTNQRGFAKLLYIIILLLSLLGAAISQGRASLIFTLFLSSLVLIWRREIFLLVIIGALGVLMLVTIRVSYEANPESIPPAIQRAVALIPGMEMKDAEEKIQGSSDWRYQLFKMALADWQSTSRNFWFGRSTSAITSEDYAQFSNPALKDIAIIDISLKRGATHNLLTDLLVNLGLIGATFVLFLWLAGIIFLMRMAKISPVISNERQLFFVAGIFAAFQLAYGLVGGAWFPIQSAVLASLAMCEMKIRENNQRKVALIKSLHLQ